MGLDPLGSGDLPVSSAAFGCDKGASAPQVHHDGGAIYGDLAHERVKISRKSCLRRVDGGTAQDLALPLEQPDILTAAPSSIEFSQVFPEEMPSLIPTLRIDLCNVISWTPKFFAISVRAMLPLLNRANGAKPSQNY